LANRASILQISSHFYLIVWIPLMTLFIFKYCLPALLGFTLFVGIAGRLNPFRKPYYPEERPSWLLGIWTGLSVALVLSVCLHMAYGMTLEGARALAKPSAWLMGAMLLPGFITYLWYQRHIQKQLLQVDRSGFNWTSQAVDLELTSILNSSNIAHYPDDPLDAVLDTQSLDDMALPEDECPVIPAFLETADLSSIDTYDLPDPIVDESNITTAAVSGGDITDTDDSVDNEWGDTASSGTQLSELDMTQFVDLGSVDAEDTQPSNQTLQQALEEENELRAETEKHLRITRKALAVLEAETREYESRKADSIIELEDQLTRSITLHSEFERMATTEKSRRVSLETNVVKLKQDLVKVKHEVRRSIAARAKALSTANKSIAFARQAVQTRARLEAELAEARETISNRQATVSSLIRALEKEKSKTEDEVASMARQLVLREQQTQARKSLEQVARSVENKLTTRLVKKVAKARPAQSGTVDKESHQV